MTIAFCGAMDADQLPHLVLLVGIESVGGLVEDQHVGIVHQRLGDADAPLEALGEGIDALVPDVGEIDALDQFGKPVVGLALGQSVHAGDEAEKVGDAHVGIGRRAFRQIAEPAPRLDRLGSGCYSPR